VQVDLLPPLQIEPAGHSWQIQSPPSEYVPAPQPLEDKDSMLLTSSPIPPVLHDAWPMVEVLPYAHGMGLTVASEQAKPAGQSLHASQPASAYCPDTEQVALTPLVQ